MKLILLVVVSCLVFHHGKGAPMKAAYKFVRCNPSGDQANCVPHQTPEMAWSPDLPTKLPASSAQFLEADPVESESPLMEEEEDEEAEEEETEEEDDEEAEEEETEEEDDEEAKEEEEDDEEEEAEEEEEEEEDEEEEEEEEEKDEEEEEEEEERWEEDKKKEEEEWENEEDEKIPFMTEEGESPVHIPEGGSGDYEGSTNVSFGDIGSGDSEEDVAAVGESRPSETNARPAEQELQEEHLLSS